MIRGIRIFIGSIVILVALSLSFLFFKYSTTEDLRYKVKYIEVPEIRYEDLFSENSNSSHYDVEVEETTDLHDLEDSEADMLMMISIILSISSILYVTITLNQKNKSSPLDMLNHENELLKKQIENNELKKRLKGINTTDSNTSTSFENSSTNQVVSQANQEGNLVLCPNCSTVNDVKYSFCSQCGHNFNIASAQKNANLEHKAMEIGSNYRSGVLMTIIWSIALSLITILCYATKNMADTNKIANNVLQGIFARPLIVLVISLIISTFFNPKENKIRKFNTTTKYIMGILSIGEVGRWFVILGA